MTDRPGVLVIGGSSGSAEPDRVRALTAMGFDAIGLPCFGGDGQPDTLTEVPLESFEVALDALAARCSRVAVLGTSCGGCAALLLGIVRSDLALVVACAAAPFVPGSPVIDEAGRPSYRSAFTYGGDPLAFLPFVDQTTWQGPAFVTPKDLWVASIRSGAAFLGDATIEVADIEAEVILVAGGDDLVWPARIFAEDIAGDRAAAGLATTVLSEAAAGHRFTLPDEPPALPRPELPRGGTSEADARLGARVADALIAWRDRPGASGG